MALATLPSVRRWKWGATRRLAPPDGVGKHRHPRPGKPQRQWIDHGERSRRRRGIRRLHRRWRRRGIIILASKTSVDNSGTLSAIGVCHKDDALAFTRASSHLTCLNLAKRISPIHNSFQSWTPNTSPLQESAQEGLLESFCE